MNTTTKTKAQAKAEMEERLTAALAVWAASPQTADDEAAYTVARKCAENNYATAWAQADRAERAPVTISAATRHFDGRRGWGDR